MFSKLLSGVAVAAFACSTAAFSQTHTLDQDAKAFGARRAASSVRISPDGNKLLYLTPGPGTQTAAVITDLPSGKTNVLVRTDGNPEALSGCDWASMDRVVCKIYAIVDTVGYMVPITRTVSMDLDGENPQLLGRPTKSTDTELQYSDGRIIDWRDSKDGKVLMIRNVIAEQNSTISNNKEGLGVELVDTRTGKGQVVEGANPNASGYMTDYRGNVRLMSVSERRGRDYTGKTKYFYRPDGEKRWQELVSYQKETFSPLAIDPTINALYAAKEKDGRNALYRVALDGSAKETLVAEDPRYDIEDVIQDSASKKVIGYTIAGERSENVYFDPEFKALAASLGRALPKSPIISFGDVTPDGRKLLLVAASDNDPGQYYIFDKVAHSLEPTLEVSPALDGYKLATMKMVQATMGDGTKIPVYLTLPPGKEAKNLPAVVIPHGGPNARDYWGFDWLSQFFAQRGYAVIQPQYRGSTGFGSEHHNDNAIKNWRQAMSDVADSVRWLSSQGISDPNRFAIFGWSYGGYSALQSAAVNPELYKAVIAVAPVTDFTLLKQDYGNNTMITDMVGQGNEVMAGSPLRNADKIKAPVLLFHGTTDVNVGVTHSDKMAAALKGKTLVEYVRYEGLDHQLPSDVARAEMLTKSAQLLDKTIGH